MSEERLMRILRAPRVSEKSTRLADSHRQFVFEVDRTARKPEIKKAVQLMFGVEVERVTVINVRGKRKGAFRRMPGKRPDWKKACVTLKPGHDIDFMGAD